MNLEICPSRFVRRWLAASASVIALGVGLPAMAQDTTLSSPDNGGAAVEEGVNGAVNEIVVTAQFREQRLQDTPIAITAVSAEMLEARAQTSLTQVAAQAPSVVLRPSTASFGPSISASIRGMGQIDFNPAFEPGVGIYIDDVYYPRLTGANFDLLDVDRVEILRGPQGTLTGRNSLGGAIRFISRRPDGNGGGYLSATYGSRERIGLRGSVDFTLAEHLYARISGMFSSQNGYVKQIDYGCAHPGEGVPATQPAGKCTVSDYGNVNDQALRGILRWTPTDAFDAMISADFTRNRRNSPAEVLVYGNSINPNVQAAPGVPLDDRFICGPYCNYATNSQPAGTFNGFFPPPSTPLSVPLEAYSLDPQSNYTGWGVAANISYTLSDAVKLTSISAYRAWDAQFVIDGDMSPANTRLGFNALDSEFASQEIRLNVAPADWADITLGGYYSDEKTTYFSRWDFRYLAIGPSEGPAPFPLPLYPLQFITDDPVHVVSKAAFATVIIEPVEALTFTGGLRYTEEEKNYTFFRYNFDGTTVNAFQDPVGAIYGIGYSGPDFLNLIGPAGTEDVEALSGKTATASGSRWDYRASLDYRISPELLVYATVSTGFKGGGVNSRPFNAQQARAFGPETLTAYEVGFKSDLFDRRLRINVSAYFNEYKGAQLTLLSCPQFGGPGPCVLPQNAGDADIKGLEAEIFFRPIENLQIDASGSLLDWDWKCVNPQVLRLPDTGQCETDPALVSQLSAPPRGVSTSQWSIGAQYTIDIPGAGSLTPRIDVNYQGSMSGSPTVPAAGSPLDLYGRTESFTVANARLTWRNADEDLDISLEVTNLFDKYYFLDKFDLTGAGAGTITGLPARPREWALTIRKTF